MNTKINKALKGGTIGTIVMTLVMMIAPLMGIPKMSPPSMLSAMMGLPIVAGWIMHFMIGVIFAMSYVFFFNPIAKIVGNTMLRGALFGLVVFLFAQIMIKVMQVIFPVQPMEENVMLMMIGSMIGHIIFGVAVSLVVKKEV